VKVAKSVESFLTNTEIPKDKGEATIKTTTLVIKVVNTSLSDPKKKIELASDTSTISLSPEIAKGMISHILRFMRVMYRPDLILLP